jgi:hypothetical protein
MCDGDREVSDVRLMLPMREDKAMDEDAWMPAEEISPMPYGMG